MDIEKQHIIDYYKISYRKGKDKNGCRICGFSKNKAIHSFASINYKTAIPYHLFQDKNTKNSRRINITSTKSS